jgi:DNA-binding NarL/FixJ family response regulator
VLQLLGRGKSTREIAQLLGLSVKTIETHRARLMQALGLGTMNALMHFAVRLELEGTPKP